MQWPLFVFFRIKIKDIRVYSDMSLYKLWFKLPYCLRETKTIATFWISSHEASCFVCVYTSSGAWWWLIPCPWRIIMSLLAPVFFGWTYFVAKAVDTPPQTHYQRFVCSSDTRRHFNPWEIQMTLSHQKPGADWTDLTHTDFFCLYGFSLTWDKPCMQFCRGTWFLIFC